MSRILMATYNGGELIAFQLPRKRSIGSTSVTRSMPGASTVNDRVFQVVEEPAAAAGCNLLPTRKVLTPPLALSTARHTSFAPETGRRVRKATHHFLPSCRPPPTKRRLFARGSCG